MKDTRTVHNVLKEKVIGISISESPDLEKLGFGDAHLTDAKTEIARHLISAGAILMYGGDLRPDGFTRNLFELVESYRPSSYEEDRLTLINVLGWPLHSTLSIEDRAKLSGKIDFSFPGLPSDISQNLSPKAYLKPSTPKEFYVWSRSMTDMRKYMTQQNDARIILGGKPKGFKGKCSGVVEEAYLSLKSNKPTYLIGAFGGASKDVIEALLGKSPERLSLAYHQLSSSSAQNIEYFNEHVKNSDEAIDYENLVDFFNQLKVDGLSNGLTVEENKRLFKTIHIPEMVSLILKGLVTVQSDK